MYFLVILLGQFLRVQIFRGSKFLMGPNFLEVNMFWRLKFLVSQKILGVNIFKVNVVVFWGGAKFLSSQDVLGVLTFGGENIREGNSFFLLQHFGGYNFWGSKLFWGIIYPKTFVCLNNFLLVQHHLLSS